MKPSVYYSACDNEIWVKSGRFLIERGMQAKLDSSYTLESIPDYLNLFIWRYDQNLWNYHLKKGWLIKLGSL